ncbi:hypothetical protein [Bradyrhizobium sp. DASA03007]|uniref:hypothetical protein n=1 Tax=unclassified Bradyrhizobium TaxID=2631580 RepID=UPI003F7064EE
MPTQITGMQDSKFCRAIRRAAISPYSQPKGRSICDNVERGWYQKAGSRIGVSALDPKAQRIGLDRGHDMTERTDELLDDAATDAPLVITYARTGRPLISLPDLSPPPASVARAGLAIKRLVGVRHVKDLANCGRHRPLA